MARISELISCTAEAAFAVDREQRLALWNSAAETLLGWKAREVRGRFCYDLLAGKDEADCLVCRKNCLTVRKAFREEKVQTRDLRVQASGGRDMWLSVATVPVPKHWREPPLLVHLVRDVSRQKGLERDVRSLFSKMNRPPDASASTRAASLTQREQQVLDLLAAGASTQTIAAKLCISDFTVRNHIHNTLAKLGAHTRLEAVALGLRGGFSRDR